MSQQGNGRDPLHSIDKTLREIRAELKGVRDEMATTAELKELSDRVVTKPELADMLEPLVTKDELLGELSVIRETVVGMAMATKSELNALDDRIDKRFKDLAKSIRKGYGVHGKRIAALEAHTGVRSR